MKKFLLAILAVTMLTGAAMAQLKSKKMIVTIANRASTFGVYVKPYDYIYIIADSALYCSRIAMSGAATGTYLTADTSRYHVAKLASGAAALLATTMTVSSNATVGGTFAATGNSTFGGTLGVTGVTTIQGQTLTADHVNNLKAGNSLTATDTLFGPVTSVSTKLILPGTSNTITKTTNNANSLTVSNSLSVADTMVAATATISGTLTGTAALRDTANFGTDASGSRNKYIRKKITGVAATDRFIVVPVMASTTATPGTAEFLGYYCTTDSLIISRNTASTAGLKVCYVRIK